MCVHQYVMFPQNNPSAVQGLAVGCWRYNLCGVSRNGDELCSPYPRFGESSFFSTLIMDDCKIVRSVRREQAENMCGDNKISTYWEIVESSDGDSLLEIGTVAPNEDQEYDLECCWLLDFRTALRLLVLVLRSTLFFGLYQLWRWISW